MYICKDCFLDEELRSEINANAVIDDICDVCGKQSKVMDFSEFYGFFTTLLELYSPSVNSNKTIVGCSHLLLKPLFPNFSID